MEKYVLVTTANRGVFAGWIADTTLEELEQERGKTARLRAAKMAIRFGTTKGIAELAHTGPTKDSRIGAPADVLLFNVTAVFAVTDAARLAWDQA